MEPDEQQTQFWGQVDQQPPSTQIYPSPNPVLIQQQVQPASVVQPIQQQGVVYIQVPKFKHPTRIASSILIGSGFVIYLISLAIGISGDSELFLALGGGTCCLAFNAAFICEIIFYTKMLEHNKTYGESNGWAIANIVFGSILTMVGLLYIVGIVMQFV